MQKVDMSEQAILSRLRTVDRLRELCLALMKAKKVSGEKMKMKEGSDTANKENLTVAPAS